MLYISIFCIFCRFFCLLTIKIFFPPKILQIFVTLLRYILTTLQTWVICGSKFMNESKITPKFLALLEDEISVSPILTVQFGNVTLESCERIMRNSVFESLIFNLWLIIQVRRSEIHSLIVSTASCGVFNLNDI